MSRMGRAGFGALRNDGKVGLAAARANLEMAIELERGDLAISRAHWMIGGHLVTSGHWNDAVEAFTTARDFAEQAGAEGEVAMATSCIEVGRFIGGETQSRSEVDASLIRLKELEGGDEFVAQIETLLEVLDPPLAM